MLEAFTLQPEYRDYLWGGRRLRPAPAGTPGAGQLTAEAWIVYEGDRIRGGAWEGQTLAQAAAQHPAELLGRKPMARTGARFPLLVKLLDCAQWLSVQVHPNDEQAARLAGPGQFGKTEAWHFLEVEPGAEILAGLKPGTSPEELAQAIRGGGLVEMAQHLPVRAGDTILIPAGMLHALGPGMLLVEVQQTSDITYRVYDWDRPASAARPLHIEQSLAVTDPRLTGELIAPPGLKDGQRAALVRCPYFSLELLGGMQRSALLDTAGDSFHLLTLTRGRASLASAGWSLALHPWETAVVPAGAGSYRVEPDGACQLLLAYVD